MYSTSLGLILGFHGCDQSIVERIISGEPILESKNSYDWLGNGIYFWENSPSRALEFATSLKNNPKSKSKIKNPAVIGAVISLGNCLDLLDYKNIGLLKAAHTILVNTVDSIPSNKLKVSDFHLYRELDCAVVETLHAVNENKFDSVRGVFWEGEPIYETAGFREKSHIQICVRNPNCIKGVFLPRTPNQEYKEV